jgi:hypothetical protein
MTHIYQHPFKEGIYGLLHKHFSDVIVENFNLIFEKEVFNPKEDKSVWGMSRDNRIVMEVYYRTGKETSEFICDLYGWESKANTEYRLLKYISDKVRVGVIGKDWVEFHGKINANPSIITSKNETTNKKSS